MAAANPFGELWGGGFWLPNLQPRLSPPQGESGPARAPCCLLFSVCAPGPDCPPGDAPHTGPCPASADPVSMGRLLLHSGEGHPYHSGDHSGPDLWSICSPLATVEQPSRGTPGPAHFLHKPLGLPLLSPTTGLSSSGQVQCPDLGGGSRPAPREAHPGNGRLPALCPDLGSLEQ